MDKTEELVKVPHLTTHRTSNLHTTCHLFVTSIQNSSRSLNFTLLFCTLSCSQYKYLTHSQSFTIHHPLPQVLQTTKAVESVESSTTMAGLGPDNLEFDRITG